MLLTKQVGLFNLSKTIGWVNSYFLKILLAEVRAERLDTLPRANVLTQANEVGAYPNKGTREIDALLFSTINFQ